MPGGKRRDMLYKLELKLQADKELNVNMGSIFQGVLMENMDRGYAETLHENRIHPYAQHLEKRDGEWWWLIYCLTEDAYENIVLDRLDSLESFFLRNKQIAVNVIDAKLSGTDLREVQELAERTKYRKVELEMLTPAAFKVRGENIIIPDVGLLIKSICNRAESLWGESYEMSSENLIDCIRLTDYRLKSTSFGVEGTRIRAFTGTMTLSARGTDSQKAEILKCLILGESTGIGIKTSIGMGAYRIATID